MTSEQLNNKDRGRAWEGCTNLGIVQPSYLIKILDYTICLIYISKEFINFSLHHALVMSIEKSHEIAIEFQEYGGELLRQSIEHAENKITKLVEKLYNNQH